MEPKWTPEPKRFRTPQENGLSKTWRATGYYLILREDTQYFLREITPEKGSEEPKSQIIWVKNPMEAFEYESLDHALADARKAFSGPPLIIVEPHVDMEASTSATESGDDVQFYMRFRFDPE